MGLRLTRSDGHTNARAHASVTTGCSRRVELGLCSSFSGRDNPRTRCPRPALARKGNPKGPNPARDWWRRSQPREHCPCLNRRGRPRRACLASASTRARREAIARCVCTSCRVAEVERRRRAQRRASSPSLTGMSSNERGLAQAGDRAGRNGVGRRIAVAKPRSRRRGRRVSLARVASRVFRHRLDGRHPGSS
jgi:hypothetical protein